MIRIGNILSCECNICILLVLQDTPFCVQISFVLIVLGCLVPVIIYNYLDSRFELNFELCVLPVFQKAIENLILPKMSVTIFCTYVIIEARYFVFCYTNTKYLYSIKQMTLLIAYICSTD